MRKLFLLGMSALAAEMLGGCRAGGGHRVDTDLHIARIGLTYRINP